MKKHIILILTTFYLTSCNREDKINNKPKQSETLLEELEPNYPWSKEVTKEAIKAIHRSIKNLQLPEEKREKNFPANPNNILFILNQVVELKISGYSQSSATPEIYEIEFKPAAEYYPGSRVKLETGPRIIVEINIKTKQPLKVFMQADA